VYRQLPQNEPLSETNVLAVLYTSGENSRSREQHVQKLQALCQFAGLDLDLKEYLGEYEPEPREIPSDKLIEEWHDRIPNPRWRWAYGVMATFGIRPHELFFSELIDEFTLQVHKGKTGPRVSHAIRPEWVHQWDLMNKQCPKIQRDSFKKYGQAVSLQMGRYNLPFVPYDLRHAWAIRASVVIGLPNSVAADLMGHSVSVHTKTYHRWLSADTNRKVYARMVLGVKD
jgi:integrase